MRILLLNPNQINRFNWGHQLFKNEIGRQHEVTYYGKGYPGYRKDLSIPKYIMKRERQGKPKFDLVITYESKWIKEFKGIGDINIPKAHIVSDYIKPREGFKGFAIWPNVDAELRKTKPDIIFVRSLSYIKDLKRNLEFEKVFFLPFSVDINKYRNMNLNRNIDVMASFSNDSSEYPLRMKIQRMITQMPISSYIKRITNDGYIKTLNKSKIFVSSGGVNKTLNMKFTETLACGTLFITEEADGMKEVGFVNGKHLVTFKDLQDLKKKIEYYLKNEKDRMRIAKAGMKFVHARHSNEVRVKQFIDKIKEEIL